MFNFSAHEDKIQSAIDRLMEHQRMTGNEGGILFDADGNEVGNVIGDDHHIEWRPEQLEAAKGGLIVHNHPNDTSLSDQDLITAGSFGLSIMAVTQDGSRFWATPEGFELEHLEEVPFLGALVLYPESTVSFRRVAEEAAKPIAYQRATYAVGQGMTREDAEIAVSHEFIWQLGKSMEKMTPWKLNYGWKLGHHAQASILGWNRVFEEDEVPLVLPSRPAAGEGEA